MTAEREDEGRDPGLEVTAVAHRLGVAAATLRSWHRRYGIGPSRHASGRRRLYRPEDVARLELMHRALVRGVPTAEAARIALAAELPQHGRPDDARPDQRPPDGLRPAGARADGGRRRSAPPGGRGLALPGAGPEARGLARAAQALDALAVRSVLGGSLAAIGVIDTWDAIVRPVLRAVAERWVRDGTGIEVEHLLSDCLVRELARIEGPPDGTRPVLLACAPGDAHTLPLSALAAALRERGVGGVRLLGADVPDDALATAAARIAPVAALVWAQTVPGPAALPRAGARRCRWYTGGPGWTAVPEGAVPVASLREATEALAAAARGDRPT